MNRYAIIRDGRILLSTGRRDSAFRLAKTATFRGVVCQRVMCGALTMWEPVLGRRTPILATKAS